MRAALVSRAARFRRAVQVKKGGRPSKGRDEGLPGDRLEAWEERRPPLTVADPNAFLKRRRIFRDRLVSLQWLVVLVVELQRTCFPHCPLRRYAQQHREGHSS